ncbi:MAG: tRNA pseudouridine(38-40) synthase TruA [Acidobacteria bacterium RIFCSPLOWO2_02_FULL_68_18]|nr:MAG: tRNA pseudouridine(38-40) synthase TruA [Acidobacteria bacterium RIFCSPLOWO2_02_FULL_68_18]OFW48434.1 MAG: tRNA pseudouridine(38-40) synthase TruA [Acidobacteria bacterium RIFCSPLOWO2_12_FULL_68_19]
MAYWELGVGSWELKRTLKLTLSYDGTRFVGWQRQARGSHGARLRRGVEVTGESIQGLLEDALARFEGAPVTVHGAGRTDAGVHALGQVASVEVACGHAVDAMLRGLNASLPPEVRVTAVEEAAPGFHARFGARSKTYRYLLRNARVVSPFERAYVWHVPEPLDLEAMQEAAAALVGTHDFAAFGSAGGETKDTIRTITRSEIFPRDAVLQPSTTIQHPGLLVYEVSGTGFLRHMVRAIVGTLVEIGRGWRPAASVPALLAGGSRADAGATAPPCGLFLVRVDYD